MKRAALGLGIIAVVALISVAATFLDLSALTRRVATHTPVDVAIFYGGEKSALLENPAVRRIVEDRYRVTLRATKAGSVEMVTTLPPDGKDCLWPSNAVVVDLARGSGRRVLSAETIFNSPIVFYAWDQIAEALTAAGAVVARDGLLVADVAQIAGLIAEGARWQEDLGVPVYGSFKVFSTDPSKSNSGNIWSGLLATALNDGKTPVAADLPTLLPRLEAYFGQMGHMEASSGDIFDNFLKQGMGARPIIVGYENQLVEFLAVNADFADLIRDRIRVIYPEPTIFASHPLIALTETCDRLTEALKDPDLQQIAWAEHGFRTGLIGVENDPAAQKLVALPATITLVAPMPSAAVMAEVIEAVD